MKLYLAFFKFSWFDSLHHRLFTSTIHHKLDVITITKTYTIRAIIIFIKASFK